LAPDDEFAQVSFVNGIFTNKGGKHVEYILNQIIRKLTAYIKAKKHVDVKSTTIKEQLMLFIRCDIENPSFDSQTKDFMNTPISNFGSSCTVSDKFVEKIAKMGVMAAACSLTEVKDNKAAKKTDGTKTRSIRNIPKLVDANFAGTEKSSQCTIIFCEGDSAKAGIISGLSKEDRNTIGVYPMKGKLFNVRGEAALRVSENKEIAEIKQIMGLETGKKYTEEEVKRKLRYGKILFMTDQDLDGSHIKGLGLNLFDSEWSTLIKLPNFIGFMNTPILKARKGNKELLFYNEGEYEKWKQENGSQGWNVKYYKGLGTSTAREFKEYFANKKMVFFDHSGDTCTNSIDMVFNKKRSDDRKGWLSNYNRELYLDTNQETVSYCKFIDQELIHFSKYDCDRSIPNLMDGLKISQRKILFAAFKKRLTNEIKVAQFSGYVSEHSGYHHGVASLNGAIVNMAQNFVGSNNINLLEPRGQFGCIDPETPVLLWNSKIEKAKNIKVGDKLIGDDGDCRIVSKLTYGIDDMYEVSNGNMDNYIVNSNHVLTLYYSGHKSIFWKKSSNSWFMNYFDDITKTIKCKSFRTTNSVTGTHFNKSKLNKDDAYEKLLEFSETISNNNIFDINVQQYLALPISAKTHMKGIINTSVIKWDEQHLDIDPYILGLWLGDGMSSCNSFASIDFEIVQSWAIWLDTIGCEVCHVKNIPPHECHSFYIRRRGSGTVNCKLSIGEQLHNSATCKGCSTSKYTCKACDWTFEKQTNIIQCEGININGHKARNLNPFKELFKKKNLYQNKHVPIENIINSEENRLKILAGMIDTDGTLRKQADCYRYDISQCEKRKHLLESFRIIAGSLGFRAKIYKTKNIYTLSITGDNIDKIPVKLPRKQIINQIRLRNSQKIHKIEIKSIGKGPFCGWNIDKNERFLLGDFTITHNTRLQGGKDSASERYIFTQLNKLTRCIYPEADDKILRYLDDDGTPVEPVYYVPIIPMILVNGSKGIGTGFSTDIMQYNPLQIIMKIRNMLKTDESPLDIDAYYEGFKGTIKPISESKYLIKGLYTQASQTIIQVTELPVGFWTEDFKQHLESLIDNKSASKKGDKPPALVRDYSDMSTDTKVDFRITFASGAIQKLLEISEDHGCNGLEKLLKLYTTQSTTNMHLFDGNEHLKKYNKLEEIIQDYYGVRLDFYQKRKDYLLAEYERELKLLSNRARFIQETLTDKIDMRKKTKAQIIEILEKHKYDKLECDEEYKYLVKMPMDSVTKENVEKLLKEKGNKEQELEALKVKTIQEIWLEELDILQEEYLKYRKIRENIQEGIDEDGKESKKENSNKSKSKKLIIKK